MAKRTAEPKPDLKEIKNKLQGMMKSPALTVLLLNTTAFQTR